MDSNQFLTNSGLDRYDRNARLYPAFLCALPLFATVIIWFPPVWTLLGGLTSLVLGSGAIYALGQLVRYQGRRVEKAMGDRVGRAKTAALLSHFNNDLPRDSRLRYHKFMRQSGLKIPTEEQEKADPRAAMEAYRSAVDWLLVHVRPNAKKSGLLNENIAYGFRRNMLGVKTTAICLLLISIGVNAYLIFHSSAQEQIVAAEVVELIELVFLVVWVSVIRADFVEDASIAYATRFLEQCESKKAVPT